MSIEADRGGGAAFPEAWTRVWQRLNELRAQAARLRRLSHSEPLAQRRPDFPRAGLERAHDDEVRDTLGRIRRCLGEVRPALMAVLASADLSGIAADERPEQIAARIDALGRLAETLAREAFQPAPTLPPHAPPYLVEPPGHDLAGTKAVLLAIGIETLVSSALNLMLSAANPGPG